MSLTVDHGGRALGVQEAYEALGDYACTYGELPLRLLLHAAVPQSFRADLLNLLKVNFVPEAGGDLSVDADVLLSPLVEATAAGYFRLDPEVRRQSLDLLDAIYRSDGSRRSIRVARFLIAWLDQLEQAGSASDPLFTEYAVIQRWVALALIDPPTVAAALARSLSDAPTEERGVARARLGGIAAALGIPLAGHQPLLSYAQGIDALRTGNNDEARRLLEPLGDREIRIGDVTLLPAADVLNAYLPPELEQSTLGPTIRVGKVFVSYSWKQGKQVWDRLVPVLRAGGIHVLIDRERFVAGKDILGQMNEMDKIQDQAGQHVLCLSAEYLASTVCVHEMRRAFESDPDFSKGKIIPLRLDATPLPKELAGKRLTTPKPLWINFANDREPEPWRELLTACNGDLGTSAVRWLETRDRALRLLERRKSVCLHVVNETAKWRTLMDDVLERVQTPTRQIDLDRGATKTRAGFINCILDKPARRLPAGGSGFELVELDEAVQAMTSGLILAIRHFDHMSANLRADADLFDVLRHLIMYSRKLVLFVQTRTPFAPLLPADSRLSKIDISTVELP